MKKKKLFFLLVLLLLLTPNLTFAREWKSIEREKAIEKIEEKIAKKKKQTNKKSKKEEKKESTTPDFKKVQGSTEAAEPIIHNVVDVPEIGKHPKFAVSDDLITVEEQAWINVTDHKIMSESDIFEAGKFYEYNIGYSCTEYVEVIQNLLDSKYSLGGGGTSGGDGAAMMGAQFYMGNQDDMPEYPFDEVTIDLNPKLGGNPVYVKKNSKLTIIEETWMNTTDNKKMKSTDVFEKNKKYEYTICFKSAYYAENLFENVSSNEYFLGQNGLSVLGFESKLTAAFYFGNKEDLKIETEAISISNGNPPTVNQPISLPEIKVNNHITDYYVYYGKATENGYDEAIEEGYIPKVGETINFRVVFETELGYSYADDFKVISDYKNANVIDEEFYDYDNYSYYGVRFKILEEGATIGITPEYESILYPNYTTKMIVYPQTEANSQVTWTSNDESIATVTSDGYVTAVKSGTAIITATNVNGEKATYELLVGVPAESLKINKSELSLNIGEEYQLEAIISPENATNKMVHWYLTDYSVATIDPDTGKVTGLSEGTTTAYAYLSFSGLEAQCEITINGPPGIKYKTHVQSYGWQDYVKNGEMSGTEGEAKRLEGIRIKLDNVPYSGNVEYRTHIQTYGWEKEWKKNDKMFGTTGEAKRLEAIEIKLTGEVADHYDVYYRVHAQKFGWLGWAKNGESAGTASYAYRLEGIEIQLVEKDSEFPEYGELEAFKDKKVLYTTHVQTYGWQEYAFDGNMAGTSGEAKRLEGIRIMLNNQKYDGDIEYRTHIQTYGWEEKWKKNNEMSGTEGEAKRLEAIQIRLTGKMQEKYDIYYRVHAQTYGWLAWAKNGDQAGTAGFAKRLEGIEIVLVDKGELPPERENQNQDKSYIEIS